MKLSLSVRIVEARCKTKLHLPFEPVVQIAADAGYDAICMRASAGGVQTDRGELEEMRRIVEQHGLTISMVTADFDVPLNNAQGPNSLRNIGPSLDVAEALGVDLVRICMKTLDDISFAQQAADEAARRGVRLAHQCHTTSLFEQVEPMLATLQQIDRPNFGLIYEPANLMLCGETYGQETLERLRPYWMNAYAQNHRLDPQGPASLPTFCRGDVRFHHLPYWEEGGVDFSEVFRSLKAIGYDGHFTIHQAEGIETLDDARAFAFRCAEFLRSHLA